MKKEEKCSIKTKRYTYHARYGLEKEHFSSYYALIFSFQINNIAVSPVEFYGLGSGSLLFLDGLFL